MASPGIISKTSAVEVSIHAVVPESGVIDSCAWSNRGFDKTANRKKQSTP